MKNIIGQFGLGIVYLAVGSGIVTILSMVLNLISS